MTAAIDEARYTVLFHQHRTFAQIAGELGVPLSTAKDRARQLGLRRSYTSPRNRKIRRVNMVSAPRVEPVTDDARLVPAVSLAAILVGDSAGVFS